MLNIADYGFTSNAIYDGTDEIPARVTAVYKERYEIVCAHGSDFARLKSSVYYGEGWELFPTTGDFVLIQHNDSGDSRIVKTLERKSFFSRREPGPVPKDQAVAANFDHVFIMASLNHDFNPRRLERYLTLAWQSGGVPIIVLTKSDLLDDCSQLVRSAEEIASGVSVHAVSAVTGAGMDSLSQYLKPRGTVVFLGSSGIGKSSLVNALAGEEIMDVREIREDDSRGRHTTTHRQLIMLKSGVMVIDTPGMRELGMWDVTAGLGGAFGDVEAFFGGCKYSDCKHENEPGCAVKAAIENSELTRERYDSYLKLKREAKYSDDKAGFMRDKQAWGKAVSKFSKQLKKNGGKR